MIDYFLRDNIKLILNEDEQRELEELLVKQKKLTEKEKEVIDLLVTKISSRCDLNLLDTFLEICKIYGVNYINSIKQSNLAKKMLQDFQPSSSGNHVLF